MDPVQTWRLIVTSARAGAWNMAVDEAILERTRIQEGDARPTLRLYAWEPACLSLGHAQPFADVDRGALERHGWDVVRRVTGGRAILHVDELTYSVIGRAAHPTLAGGVLESYSRLAQALLGAVQSLGLPVEMKERTEADRAAANPICFEVPSAYEITLHGRKLIGSAQARRGGGVLQHGSLPLTGDLTRICQALAFDTETARQEAAGRLLRRATTIESALGRSVTWDAAARAFIEAFESQLGVRFEREDLSATEISRTEELVREKYGNRSWTERA